MRRTISPRRLIHTLGVTHTMVTLAALHRLDLEQAALAGLLHDHSKEFSPKELLHDLVRRGCALPEEDHPFPNTWHGYHAALVAQLELGVEHPEVLEAITLHTTADAQIGPLTKAIFIADLCEPGRPIKAGAQIVQAAREDLDEGFRQALLHKTQHVMKKRKAELHPKAARALRHYAQIEPEELLKREMPLKF